MSLQGNLINMISDKGSNGYITPSNTASNVYRGLWVCGTGDVAVEKFNDNKDGIQQIFTAVPAGTFLPIHVRKVLATGTDATNIIGL